MSSEAAAALVPAPPAAAPEQPVAIAVEGVSKSYHLYASPQDRLKQALFGRWRTYYREFFALKGIDLEVRRGEAVGLIGRNGAGKSTLLHIVSSILTPTTGRVAVTGRVAPLLQLGTSFNPEFTGRENIAIAARVLGLSDAEIAERQDSIIDFAEIGEFIDRPVRTYSSGMSARLAFAVAAHVDADILIVDEVLSVGDIGFTQKCARFIRGFREKGTLLFVSHDIGAVLSLCDRAVWIDHGEIVEDAPPKRVIPHYSTWIADPMKMEARAFVERVRSGEANAHPRASGAALIVAPPPPTKAPVTAAGVQPAGQPATQMRFEGFDWNARSAGVKEGRIVDAWWENAAGERIKVLSGGDLVTLCVKALSEVELLSPIVGFSVKDRLAQIVFAWDTSKEVGLLGQPMPAGRPHLARFTFRFPHLRGGDYAVSFGLSDGTPDLNVHQHRVYDALPFHVTASRLVQGMIGVPIDGMDLRPL